MASKVDLMHNSGATVSHIAVFMTAELVCRKSGSDLVASTSRKEAASLPLRSCQPLQ
jgi:hypothetical protein